MNRKIEVLDGSWAVSPCSSCLTSPCCTRLPLHRFRIETEKDFRWAEMAVRHPRIEIGLYETGWWMVYYLAPCRFLNPLDSKCLIHGSDRQPQVCKDYSPALCWYKRVFVEGDSPDFIRFDAERLSILAGMVRFDESGGLSQVPSWEEMHGRFEMVPISEPPAGEIPVEQYAPLDPEGLIVPVHTPRCRRDVGFLRFRLGFHGVRLGISADGWVAVIGNPPEASTYRILRFEELEAFLASIVYDDANNILSFPPAEGSANPAYVHP